MEWQYVFELVLCRVTIVFLCPLSLHSLGKFAKPIAIHSHE